MYACKEAENVKAPGDVIPRCLSHSNNEIGVHWLRISFNYKDLQKVKEFVGHFYSDNDSDGYGLWSYDSRIIWASGVSLNYDRENERCQRVHKGRITLDVPGSACDLLTAPDLVLFIEGAFSMGGKCTRIDIFFDDYQRLIEVTELAKLARRGDFSKFISWHIKESGYRSDGKRGKLGDDGTQIKRKAGLTYSEVSFGSRGSTGSGKYLRIYDKLLESGGKFDCIRWEVEFSQRKAQEVFMVLAGTSGDMDIFATICGALIGGCINFVHRNGDRNIGRLDVYEFWDLITKSLGKLTIRIEKKKNTLTGVIEWTERQVAPSLACVRKSFVSDQKFFAWVTDILDDGESRMNANQRQIVKRFEGSMNYDPKTCDEKQESDYVRLTCSVS